MKKEIVKKPVLDTINKIDNSSKGIILLSGGYNTGKSTVLEEYKKEESGRLVVDCTMASEDYIFIPKKNVYRLYQICIILSKLTDFIKENYPDYYDLFFGFVATTRMIMVNIKSMYMKASYGEKEILFEDLYYNSDQLIDQFLTKSLKIFDNEEFTLLIDDFDINNVSSDSYQKELYSILKGKFHTILAVSDNRLSKDDFRKRLLVDNDIVDVNYSYDIDYVREILDQMIVNEMIRVKDFDFRKRIMFILTDSVVEKLIILTNGNITEMYKAVICLADAMKYISKDKYIEFLNNYFEEKQEQNKELIGMIRERRLNI